MIRDTELVIARAHILQEGRTMDDIVEIALKAQIDLLKELLEEFEAEARYTDTRHAIFVVSKNLDILNMMKVANDD